MEKSPKNGSIPPSPVDNKLNQSRRLLFALLGLVAFIALPVFRFILPEDSTDSLALRFAIGGACLLISLLALRRNTTETQLMAGSYAALVIIITWFSLLLRVNQFRFEYTLTYFAIYFTISLIIRDRYFLLGFTGYATILPTLLWLFCDDPQTSLLLFASLATYCAIALNLVLGFRIAGEKKLGDEGVLLRGISDAAFEASKDAILIVDDKGRLKKFNKIFIELWQFPEVVLNSNIPRAGIDRVHAMLLNPKEWEWAVEEARANPETETYDLQYFKDGRVVERYSRPLKLEGTSNWRLWYFRDITHEKKSEIEIRNNLMVLRAIIDQSELGILVVDSNRKVLDFNSRYLEIWGIDENFLLHSPPEQIIEHNNRKIANLAPAAEGLSPFAGAEDATGKALLEFHDGRIVERFITNLKIGELSAGRVLFFRDITESIQAQQRVQQTLNLLRAVFDLSNVGIVVFDENNHPIDFNDLYLKTWNLTHEFLTTSTHEEFAAYCHSQLKNPEEAARKYHTLLAQPGRDEFAIFEFSDGRVVERNVRSILTGSKHRGRVFFYYDITERLRADEHLRQSEARNTAILTALPDQLLRINRQGIILDYVGNLEKLGNFDAEGLQGKSVTDVFGSKNGGYLQDELLKVIGSDNPAAFELEMPSGEKVAHFDARIAKIGEQEVLLILRDITLTRVAERKLDQRNFELDTFIYRASHDLKAPLNSIMGLLDIMNAENKDAQLAQYIKLMGFSVTKLESFIHSLALFNKNENAELTSEFINMEGLVRKTFTKLSYLDSEGRIKKEIISTGDPGLFSDPFRVEMIIENLLSNALKFQNRTNPNSFVRVSFHIDKSGMKMTVADNGIGIPPEFRDRIFTMFFRATPQSFGSGMGLYLTQNAVRKLGGNIEVHSLPGEGAQFELFIPQLMAVPAK